MFQRITLRRMNENHVSDKGMVCRIFKKLLYLRGKKGSIVVHAMILTPGRLS